MPVRGVKADVWSGHVTPGRSHISAPEPFRAAYVLNVIGSPRPLGAEPIRSVVMEPLIRAVPFSAVRERSWVPLPSVRRRRDANRPLTGQEGTARPEPGRPCRRGGDPAAPAGRAAAPSSTRGRAGTRTGRTGTRAGRTGTRVGTAAVLGAARLRRLRPHRGVRGRARRIRRPAGFAEFARDAGGIGDRATSLPDGTPGRARDPRTGRRWCPAQESVGKSHQKGVTGPVRGRRDRPDGRHLKCR